MIPGCSLCGRPAGALQADLFTEPDCPRCAMRLLPPPPDRPERPRGRVVLVGCGAAKRPGRHPAAELYTGSLFRAARRAAEASGAPWRILSALHGLLDPAAEVEAYESRAPRRTASSRYWAAEWGARVVAQLAAEFPGLDLDVEILAGRDYAEPLREALQGARGGQLYRVTTPLDGLGLGRRLAALTRRTQEVP